MRVGVDIFDLAPVPGLEGLMESSPQKHCVNEEDGYDTDTMTIEKTESRARSNRGRKRVVCD